MKVCRKNKSKQSCLVY